MLIENRKHSDFSAGKSFLFIKTRNKLQERKMFLSMFQKIFCKLTSLQMYGFRCPTYDFHKKYLFWKNFSKSS